MLGNQFGSQSQLLGFEDLGILRCCVLFLFLLWVINLGLYFSFSLSLSLPVSLYSFCSGHNIDCDNGIFFGFALFGYLLCFTFVYSFWYLQLCLFYFFLSGATILTVINNGIFLLVFALFVWVHVFPLSYCMFFNFFICLLA